MSPILKQVLAKNCLTEKQFFSTNSLLVQQAREEFIRTAYFRHLFSIDQIVAVIGMKRQDVEYHVQRLLKRAETPIQKQCEPFAGASPLRSTPAAAPKPCDLHTGAAAFPIPGETSNA